MNRDIKLENTLLDSSPRPLVKICDFGYSKVLHGYTLQDARPVPLLGACDGEQCVFLVRGGTAAFSTCGHYLRTFHVCLVPIGRNHRMFACAWVSHVVLCTCSANLPSRPPPLAA